jgi:hypothetical protein
MKETLLVWRPERTKALEENMLEWKPRLVLLLVALASLALFMSLLQLGVGTSTGHYGW